MAKNYLHPVNNKTPFKSKHFKIKQEGKTPDGTIVRQITSSGSEMAHDYRFGIQVLPNSSDDKSMIVFGNYDDINSVASEIQRNPDKVMNSIRPVGPSPSNAYYLNKPAPAKTHAALSEISKDSIRAKRMYPNEGRDQQPVSRMQQEKRDFRTHLNGLKEKTYE